MDQGAPADRRDHVLALGTFRILVGVASLWRWPRVRIMSSFDAWFFFLNIVYYLYTYETSFCTCQTFFRYMIIIS